MIARDEAEAFEKAQAEADEGTSIGNEFETEEGEADLTLTRSRT